jgi:hypothetical protein
MKKENFLVVVAALYILAYVLDHLAGPVSIIVKNPFAFLSSVYLTKFPFTAVAIGSRPLALTFSLILLFSFVNGAYFIKALVFFFLGTLAELYAVQQIATGMRMTPIQWTLSFAYSGLILIIPIIYYLLRGMVGSLHSTIVNQEEPINNDDSKDKS